jgi:hypothetical protein
MSQGYQNAVHSIEKQKFSMRHTPDGVRRFSKNVSKKHYFKNTKKVVIATLLEIVFFRFR